MDIRKSIGEIEYNAIVLRELLDSICEDHLTFTLEGARQYHGDTVNGSYWWLSDHYDSMAAMTRAARIIAEIIEATAEQLREAEHGHDN